jgi:hypothetical protein
MKRQPSTFSFSLFLQSIDFAAFSMLHSILCLIERVEEEVDDGCIAVGNTRWFHSSLTIRLESEE